MFSVSDLIILDATVYIQALIVIARSYFNTKTNANYNYSSEMPTTAVRGHKNNVSVEVIVLFTCMFLITFYVAY